MKAKKQVLNNRQTKNKISGGRRHRRFPSIRSRSKKVKMENIGQRLKARRLEKKLTLDEVYQKTKIHPRVLSALEEGVAQENLTEVYIKNFLSDYAGFLDMDAQKIVKEYLSFASSAASPFSIGNKKIFSTFKSLKGMAILALVFIVLLWGIFSALRNKQNSSASREEKLSHKSVVIKSTAKMGFPQIQSGEQINLVLKAKKKVWMQVKSDDKIVFQDILKNGDNECWLANDSIELWVGDGNAIELELNGRKLGSPGAGVIKNIIITRQGMEVGNR